MNINKILISQSDTIFNAMKKMNMTGHICLLVIDKSKKLKGTISDGDIRRNLLKENNLKKRLIQFLIKNIFLKKQKLTDKMRNFIIRNKHMIIPIVNQKIFQLVTYLIRQNLETNIKSLKKIKY